MRAFNVLFGFLGLLLLMSACAEDARVGSRDCAVLESAPGFCDACQGISCEERVEEASPFNCEWFPCVDGVRVVQGCTEDSHCDEFDGMWCGMGTSPHGRLCGTEMGAM